MAVLNITANVKLLIILFIIIRNSKPHKKSFKEIAVCLSIHPTTHLFTKVFYVERLQLGLLNLLASQSCFENCVLLQYKIVCVKHR